MTRRSYIDRRALFASGAAAALLAASGVSAGSLPRRGGRLRMALSGASREDVFDPRAFGSFAESHSSGLFMQVAMAGVLFETLTEVAADGTLRGELATAWRSNEDATMWEFSLREDVSFHNGAPFTSADVTRLAIHANAHEILDTVERVVVAGEHKVRFDLHTADRHLPFKLANPQLCILPHADVDIAMQQGIGTGPYRLRKFDAGRHLIADRVDRHHKDGQAAWFDVVELVGIASDEVRAEALRDHYVDVADLTHMADVGDVEGLTALPRDGFMNCAVDNCVALPSQIGEAWPLDNLRAPQRWWMA